MMGGNKVKHAEYVHKKYTLYEQHLQYMDFKIWEIGMIQNIKEIPLKQKKHNSKQ